VRAEQIRFGLLYRSRLMAFEGTVAGETMSGEVSARAASGRWTAQRRSPPSP
jgi:hypothetical protein